MRNYTILLALLFLAGCFQKNNLKDADRLDEKLAPNDQFSLQRSYPDAHFDLKAFEKALLEARQMDAQRITGFDSEWTVQGPGNIGARINTIAIHPTNEDIIFVGFAQGGVWRTTDGGANWVPVFDEQLSLSIGDIEFDPSNPQTIYVGTGDPNITGYPFIGNGIYRSTDGGNTWEHLGLLAQRIISKIIVHPTDPEVIFAATMGIPFERNNDRGLYRSSDGGATWEQVLFISDQAGIISLLMDPFNPDVLYASGWDRIRNNNESLITGPGSKIFKSTDGGDTWAMLENGLPMDEQGRTGLAISALTPGLVYALVVGTNSQLQGIYRSENAGASWSAIDIAGTETALGGFGWYFGKLHTDPTNDDLLYLLGVDLWLGLAEGGGWTEIGPPWWEYSVHADKHDLAFANGNLYLATDGGLYRSPDGGNTFEDMENIPTTQFYRVAVNPHQPELYYGGAQDNGSTGGNAANINDWPRIFGGDGFQLAFHPADPAVFFVETQNGNISMTTDGGASFFPADDGIDGGDRRNWDMPYLISRHNPDVMYTGTFRMYRSEGAFPNFYPISEDLSDGLILAARYHTITALDESPLEQGLLYVGTVDANVWRTDDDGATWEPIWDGLPERYVTSVKASPSNMDGVYVTHSGYKDNDFIPRLHRSTDRGLSWEDISSDLPNLAINDVYILPGHADSVIFAATDGGIYATLNSGENWHRLGTNMPYVPSYDLEWNPSENTLVAGTHARSIMTYPLDSLLVTIPPDTTTAVRPVLVQDGGLRIFPNPAKSQVTVEFSGLAGKTTELVLLDASGKLMRRMEVKGSGKLSRQVNLNGFPSGSYVVKVKTGHVVRTGRFVKG